MARTAVTYSNWVANASFTDPAGTTIDAALVTNGVKVEDAVPERTVIRVANTAASALDATVQSGNRWMGGQGDIVKEVAANTGVQWLGPFASARVLQADGSMYVDFETGFTGTVTVFKLPRNT